ncbi:MAG: DUF6922 domain-containing protein [Candidatus Dojkabacteria bacterium]
MRELLNNKTLFWDVETKDLDLNAHRNFIIARVLEDGTLEQLRVMLKYYGGDQVAEVVKTSRSISPKTGYFWKNYFNITSEVACIQKHSRNSPKMPWQS